MIRTRRALVRVLVLFLVPVVIVATPGVGNAANFNDWQRLTVIVDAGPLPDAVQPTCSFPARYNADGSGVAVGTGVCRKAMFDSTPGAPELAEPGSQFSVRFEGERAGEAGSDGWQWSGMTYTAGYPFTAPTTNRAYALDADPSINPHFYGGSTSGTIYIRRHPSSDPSKTFRPAADVKCAYPDGTGSEMALSAAGGALIAAGQVMAYQSWSCKTAGKSLSYAMVWNSAISSGSPDQVAQHQNFIKNAGAVIAPGAGEGDPCQATYSGTLTDHPDDGLIGIAGTMPGGAAAFDAGVGGYCHVTRVCVTLSASNGWAPDAEATGCKNSAWGAPWEAPSPDDVDEPEPLAPGEPIADAPETEGGFWSAVLTLLRGIWNGIAELGKAIGGIATAILDGLIGLFVPSDGFWSAKVDSAKGAWGDTPPGLMVSEAAGIPDLFVAPTDVGCKGPAFDVNLPFFAEGGPESTSWHLFDACGDRAWLATVSRTVLLVATYVGVFMVVLRILSASVGVTATPNGGAA